MDDLVTEFVLEASDSLAGLQSGLAALSLAGAESGVAAEMLRRMHALKGLCGFAGFARAEAIAHAAESLLVELRQDGRERDWRALALLADALEQLAVLIGAAAVGHGEAEGEDDELITSLERAASRRDPDSATDSDPKPDRRARPPWAGLDTLARGLGDRLGKRIELMIGGDDVRVTLEASAPLRAALIALVRNACDHGIEPPEERRLAGKPGRARLQLTVRHTAQGFAIDLADDGRGVDPERVRRRAEALGVASGEVLAGMDVQALQRLVFTSGFSTIESATVVSGRGVGLELVAREVERIGGSMEMESVPARGTRFTLNLPESALAGPASRRLAAA
jgi:two-component system chemotaxis sensor kinase CheA